MAVKVPGRAQRLNYLGGNVGGMPSPCGTLLKRWRDIRDVSQLELATDAGVSARHLSFIESGRSKPSREMLLTLADALDVPLRERNALLNAAGFAPQYRESGLDSQALAPVLRSLETVLERMDPYPCVVMNRTWEVLRANQAAMRLFAVFLPPELAEPPLNLVRLLFEPRLRAMIGNWEQIAPAFAQQLHREVLAGDAEARALLDEVLSQPGVPQQWRSVDLEASLPAVVPLKLEKEGLALSLFTLVSTLGTPLDVTLQELRIETYVPMDEATEAALRH
jgi:transcriptional regulator with XRE-family HTH domain